MKYDDLQGLDTTEFLDFPVFLFLIILTSSDAASMKSTVSDELHRTRISYLQEIINPHPNLANRMYFV